MIGLSVWGAVRYNNSPASQGDDWRLATRYVLAGQQPEDAVFLYRASGSWPFAYYLQREMEEHRVTSSPTVVFPFDPTNPQQEPDSEQTSVAIRGRKRIWLILQHYEGPPARMATLRVIQAASSKITASLKRKYFPGQQARSEYCCMSELRRSVVRTNPKLSWSAQNSEVGYSQAKPRV